ncbi:MAG: alpha-2-macroglobulin family protein [Myxococcota bacterium]
MLRRRSAVALLLTQALACQPVQTSGGGAEPASPDTPFVASPGRSEGLVFPPASEANPRRKLPRGIAKAEAEASDRSTRVEWPELDGAGKFEIVGQTLYIHFNRSIKPPPKDEPALTIEPAVDGEISWSNPWVLAFRAEAPFDPETEYTVALGDLHDVEGEPAAEGWTGVFTAEPRVHIAGKVISYLPEAGAPQMVTVRPHEGPQVGPAVAPEVLFDQPVTLAQAKTQLEGEVDGKPCEITLAHPEKDLFDGAAVDREHVVIARPAKALDAGSSLVLRVSEPDGSDDVEFAYEVAEPLAFEKIECEEDYWRDDTCTWKDQVLSTQGERVKVRFNNPIGTSDKALGRKLKVSPRVDELRIQRDPWASDGTVWISGRFKPSTTYRVELGRVKDRFGSRSAAPLKFEVDVAPMASSVSMPEGQQVLDEAASRTFAITTRNVKEARLDLWEVEPNARAWTEARQRVSARERPISAPDLSIPVRPRSRRDKPVTTRLDLLDSLAPGKTYLARLELGHAAFGAPPPAYPEWAMAARPSTALITPHDDRALAVHVHEGTDKTLIQVARLGDGSPVRGAQVLVDGTRQPGIKTNADGVAVLKRPLDADTARRVHVVEVESDDRRAVLALGVGSLDERELAPELAGTPAPLEDIRALLFSDRGVYRPGATVELKGIVQFRKKGRLHPAPAMPVGMRIHSPTGKEVFAEASVTSTMGSTVDSFSVPANAEIGRYRVELVAPLRANAVIARYGIQVAEFEPPRFTVDVETKAAESGKKLEGTVNGRYLFGAVMEDAPVTWTLRRSPAAMPKGPLPSKGFVFRPVRSYWEDDDTEAWVRVGEGQLDARGLLAVTPAVELPADQGPQRFVLEAEVTDESHRAIASRSSVVMHPSERYAGIKLAERWLDVGTAIPMEAGVVDQSGATVSGVPVELRLEHLEWKRVRKPGPGGAASQRWHQVSEEVARCTTKGADTSACSLVPKRSGTYRVSAWLDGRRGGSMRVWAWGRGSTTAAPSPGRRLEIIADRSGYEPGDTAELMVRNPFPAATAILTVEQGGILHHETRQVTESAVRFDVKLGNEHAPHAHATVTLLPRDAKDDARVDWKIGAVRLPVDLSDNRLDVTIASDQDRYAPGDSVDIVIDVSQSGTAIEGAEVALAVVDEGVLRMTNFHAPDPVSALYPGQGLNFRVDDSRRLLAEQLGRSHVAGDGSGAGSHSVVSTRKNFVKTALWKPQLRTDADGRAHARFTLPDNLTRFRMMAVVVDTEGRGGVDEDDFEVQKPLMAIPAVPRFALIGDKFEAAVLVHNNQETTQTAAVSEGGMTKTVEIAAGGRARVPFELSFSKGGTKLLHFTVADAEGTVRDAVQVKVPVQAPGIDERPNLHGTFLGSQEVTLRVPEKVFADATGDDFVTVTMGENLWPELGTRLQYLLGYPHGCVEQTTSSTLPLLAAREILPRLGMTPYDDDELRKMIEAGVVRLSTMRTSAGGLAYWPGGHEPNPFGTAYATLAIARAQELGIEAPEGMVDGMRDYMLSMLESDSLPHGYGVEVRASLALALAELEALPPERADSLWDTVPAQGAFGVGTLALALSTLPGQEDRVESLLDQLEASFGDDGTLRSERKDDDFLYFGSDRRTTAQALIALHRLRPQSRVVPHLVGNLVRMTPGYTTQSTAYSLLALAEKIQDEDGTASRQRALLDGEVLTPEVSGAMALGPNIRRYRIPLSKLRGRSMTLTLQSESTRAQAFMVSARWRRAGAGTETLAETTSEHGPDLYRVYTDAKGRSIDPTAIEPGQVLRVVLLARMPRDLPSERRGYLALTDRIPAGFEAMQPDLWTVATVPELDDSHPLYDHLRWRGGSADHLELRDDRAHFYFDRVWGQWAHATYLIRATTPGIFATPPAMAELMYEPDSAGYTDARNFTVVQ